MPVAEFHALRIAACETLAEDAVRLRLDVPAALRGTFAGQAGQHVVLRADIDGNELRRTYSLVNPPGAAQLELGVRIHPEGRMSRHLAALPVGSTIDVLPPAGSFIAAGDAGAALLLAAGCGITPVLAVTRQLLEQGTRCTLVYGNRSAARTMFVDAVSALKDVYLQRLTLQFVTSREPQDRPLASGRIDAQWLRTAAGRLFEADCLDGVWVCGPGDMNDVAATTLTALGTDPTVIHGERFTVDTDAVQAPQGEPPDTPPGDGVRVTVVMDGRERGFVAGADDTLLQAGLAAGLDLPYSCCGGVCSTCRVRVIDGAADMDVNYALEDWEVELGFVLACQARPRGAAITISYDDR